jgi:16S rRNA (cytidine1402-2'-O)-methyltransferase
MSQKSYDNTPTLYLVPTPIGNLEDITARAIKTLENVEVIFSEDTRVTINLLNHLNIKKKLIATHKFNEEKSSEKMLEYLNKGFNIALVSDRGTPLISDPGSKCVKTIIEKGYNVVSIPGATAFVPALTMSGLNADRFLFYGFLDSKEQKMKKELEELKKLPYTIIIYEAPHRILKTLNTIKEVFEDRRLSISREISKSFEEVYRGTAEIISREIISPKGEYVIIIEGKEKINTYEHLSIVEHVNLYIKEGKSEKDAFKLVAKDRDISKSDVYNEYTKNKK